MFMIVVPWRKILWHWNVCGKQKICWTQMHFGCPESFTGTTHWRSRKRVFCPWWATQVKNRTFRNFCCWIWSVVQVHVFWPAWGTKVWYCSCFSSQACNFCLPDSSCSLRKLVLYWWPMFVAKAHCLYLSFRLIFIAWKSIPFTAL